MTLLPHVWTALKELETADDGTVSWSVEYRCAWCRVVRDDENTDAVCRTRSPLKRAVNSGINDWM